MFAMFRHFFAMISSLFIAGEKLANAGVHAASFVEGEAAGFNERTELARMQELKKLRSLYSKEDYVMAAEEALARSNSSKVQQDLLDSAKIEEKATKPTK